MKAAAPTLAPILRSDLQGDILALLLLHPEREYSLTEIARTLGSGLSRVHGELNRLTAADLLAERRVGATRLVRANPDNPLARPLTEMLELTYGPTTVLPQVLSDVSGIEQAFVFGSWAARRAGEPGPPPADVDVLVVGRPTRADLHAAADRAEKVLRRPVNVQRVSRHAWNTADSSFLKQVKARPLIELDLAGSGA